MEASPFSPRDLAASHKAPDARYRVTSVPFLFRILYLIQPPAPPSVIPPYPSLASVRGASHVSNRYRPRCTSDARFPAPWSLPAAPASPPHTVFSRMKSLSNSFVHVGPAKGETTRLSKLGDRSPKREQPGSLGDYSRSLCGRVGQGWHHWPSQIPTLVFDISGFISLLQNTGEITLGIEEVLQKRCMAARDRR